MPACLPRPVSTLQAVRRAAAPQAFLRLTARASGDAAYFAATKGKGSSLVVTAKSEEVQKQVGAAEYSLARMQASAAVVLASPLVCVCMLPARSTRVLLTPALPARLDPLPAQVGMQPGAYDAALLVGDSRSAQPVEWALGEVQVRIVLPFAFSAWAGIRSAWALPTGLCPLGFARASMAQPATPAGARARRRCRQLASVL